MTEFYFVAGKGGVGKTSTAAALSVILSKKGKTLVVSTDPAHNLCHIFKKSFKNRGKVMKNLWIEEIDPKKAADIGKQFFGFDVSGPGIDELTAFNQFLNYLDSKEFDYTIFDTAPTGHTLRLLSLPNLLNNWLFKMKKLVFFFSGKTDPLERLREKIEKCKEVMQGSRFYAVLIPEKMSILETKQALEIMKKYNLKFEKIIINKVLGSCVCSYCRMKRKEEAKRIKEIKNTFKIQTVEIPLFNKEVYGIEMIKKFASYLEKQKHKSYE